MNKIHALAKVLITIIDIYWLIKAFGWLIQSFAYIFANTSNRQIDIKDILMISASIAFQLVIILFLITVLCRRDKIAEKIVGKTEIFSVPQSQLDWIPFAYRLVSVIAGLYCFSTAIFYLGRLANSFMFRMRSSGSFAVFNSEIIEQCISLFIVLAVGIYLFCGAPHFVRWQVRKTIEMCTGSSAGKNE